MNDIGVDKKQQYYIIKKVINIAIRATCYIFCCRNRNWDSPDLMQFWFFVFFCFWILFCFVFVCLFVFFFFLVNCLYVARFKNTNKVSIIIITGTPVNTETWPWGGTTIYGLYSYVPLWRVWFSSSFFWDKVYKLKKFWSRIGYHFPGNWSIVWRF